MPRRIILLTMLQLLSMATALCQTQSATCTNWKFFQLPSPWIPPYLIYFGGIDRWGSQVGIAQWNGGGPQGGPVLYGFVRYGGGGFKTYLVPNSSFTFFTRRNKFGATVGYYGDSSSTRQHGLIYSNSGTVTIDYPGAFWTILSGINNWGTMVGYHYDGAGGAGYPDGFKLKNGKFTRIHYLNSLLTVPYAINLYGTIVGFYWDNPNFGQHGFVRENGVYKKLDYPNSSASQMILSDINASGTVVGHYTIGTTNYAFLHANGTFKDIVPPNRSDTVVLGINAFGTVFGLTGLSSGSSFFTAHCQ